jgi:hypothetical protein
MKPLGWYDVASWLLLNNPQVAGMSVESHLEVWYFTQLACHGRFIASSYLLRNPSTRIDSKDRRANHERMQTLIFRLPSYSTSFFQLLSIFKIVILLFVVITGWVVLSGKTRVTDPHYNFRNAFAGSSTSSYEVRSVIFLYVHLLIMVLTVCHRYL